MADDDPVVQTADAPRGLDVRLGTRLQDRCADEARVAWPVRDRNGDHRVLEARAQRRDHRHRKQKVREGEEHVGDAHDDLVNESAVITGQRAEHATNGERDAEDEDDDLQRDSRAGDDAAEDVATDGIGPEPVGRSGGLKRVVQILGCDGVRRDYVREDGQDEHDKEQRDADHCSDIAADAAGRAVPRLRRKGGTRHADRCACREATGDHLSTGFVDRTRDS